MTDHEQRSTLIALVARGGVGGVLMGLANLVPGISGGTMLLAVGLYPRFIRAVAEVTTFRFRVRSLLLLGCVAAAAVIAIVALAGVVKGLVIDHRWVMYSLFIGLTLGGVPLLWRMLRPVTPPVGAWAVVGIAAMAALAVAEPGSVGAASDNAAARMAMLVVAGIAGGAAMILPGVSGAYLLLVLGQYLVILGAIESARDATADRDWAQLAEELRVFIPVGVGVVIGVVGVSNAVKLCLDRFPRATLGVLMGLLLGAVVGLWPFQEPVSTAVTTSSATESVAYFSPTVVQAVASLGLVCLGFVVSMLVCRVGAGAEDRQRQNRPTS
ncbi:MAG: undecaprenyl phosphate translocase family protein [Planctomycetota bacterium]|jgi:putative membrane protein